MQKSVMLLSAAVAAAGAVAAATFLKPIGCNTHASSTSASYRTALLSLRQQSFALPAKESDVAFMSASKLVVFGEIHETPPCIELQRRAAVCLLESMKQSTSAASALHIVLEHFNFEAQPSLTAYADGSLSFASLAEGCGYEGHDIHMYQPLLELAREHPGRVNLHAGFIPRHYARIVMREGLQPALTAAKAKGYIADDETCHGSDAHYNFFESLLTGRSMHDASRPPVDTYRDMFPAQVIKDASMAHSVTQLLAASPPDDRFLVVCGVGHCAYSYGVPERIFSSNPNLQQQTFRIISLPLASGVDVDSPAEMQIAVSKELGGPGTCDPADMCLAFAEVEADCVHLAPASSLERIKSETAAAYDAVGDTAHMPGNMLRASAIMTRLGYTHEQIAIAGADAPNFQGVGTPHTHAAIQPGDAVLDIGSGLGVDSFIAASAATAAGSVVGVDISSREVQHAAARAAARGLARLSFVVGDLERLPLADGCVDVVISNGAFCLAPDKAAAFREVARVLKPGGRFSVCTSVVKTSLQPGKWPLCMRMFAELSSLAPACQAAGLTNVLIDDSDPLMAFELADDSERGAEAQKDEADGGSGGARNRVHTGSSEFKHLAQYDMNQLCARVVITGTKPA
jgi:SAM-dependent methyltransferase/uncharacterized iron-regulated protein